MIESGMGRTRLGRFALVTVPAVALSAGLGVAILQGSVAAALSSANAFQVTAATGTGDGVELSLRGAQAAAADGDATSADKASAFVTLKNGSVTDVCLAANTNPGIALLPNIGLQVDIPTGAVNLGAVTDLNATDVGTDVVLPSTTVGVAQNELTHQKTVTDGMQAGAFGIQTADAPGSVELANVDAKIYQVTVGALNVAGVKVTPTTAIATC